MIVAGNTVWSLDARSGPGASQALRYRAQVVSKLLLLQLIFCAFSSPFWAQHPKEKIANYAVQQRTDLQHFNHNFQAPALQVAFRLINKGYKKISTAQISSNQLPRQPSYQGGFSKMKMSNLQKYIHSQSSKK